MTVGLKSAGEAPTASPEETVGAAFVGDFLRARDENDSFIFIEFGHGESPAAFIQPRPFTGQRAAIGIETWFRDMYGVRREAAHTIRKADLLRQNVFFIDHDPGGIVTYEKLGAICHYEDGGEYSPETRLPNGAGSETFASNVFGDEHHAVSEARTLKLLAEMARVTESDGYVVIRETIHPLWNSALTNKNTHSRVGLEERAFVTSDDAYTWAQLEAVYNAERAHQGPNRDSFYLIMQKT